MVKEQIEDIRVTFVSQLAAAKSKEEVEAVRVAFLGKKSPLSDLLKGLRDMTAEEKKEAGQQINLLKSEMEKSVSEKAEAVEAELLSLAVRNAKKYNPTIPASREVGSYHPITLIASEVERIFTGMGFTVEDYYEVVDDYQCFESLNIPKHHPARDMQDTYYLENGQLLKT
ncbi:MAG: phenylalanine--tRNA ligase subunit alpha, partial [Clostridia bacterium]|nr:phenylalanine--tRNA ligase subunit alpha [Clostridia bacterium]